jgi:hypothetical protein
MAASRTEDCDGKYSHGKDDGNEEGESGRVEDSGVDVMGREDEGREDGVIEDHGEVGRIKDNGKGEGREDEGE